MRQRIPHARETIAGEVCVVARGEFADAMMAQGERQARVKDAPASCVRFSRPAPDAFHHGRNFSRMIDERPGRMLAELLDEARGIGTVQRVLDDRRVAQEDVKLESTRVRRWRLHPASWEAKRRKRGHPHTPGSPG